MGYFRPVAAQRVSRQGLTVSGHDSAADTLVPRLGAHGADLKRVHFLDGFAGAGEPETARRFVLRGLLEQAMRERPGVKMVVIDPVSAFLSDRAAHARGPLAALQGLAGRCGAAFILVAGLSESAGSKAAAIGPGLAPPAVAGSPGLVVAARSVWVVTHDPGDPLRPSTSSGLRRLFMPAKNNVGIETRGYAWRLAGGKVQWEVNRVEKAGGAGAPDGDRARGRRLAAAFIADFLKNGPRMWDVVEFNARRAGHKAAATLPRARSNAEPFKRREADGRWLWRLIGDERTSSEGDAPDLFGSGEGIGFAGRGGRRKTRRRSAGAADIEPDDADDDQDDEDDEDAGD